jgi:hypothetical protein
MPRQITTEFLATSRTAGPACLVVLLLSAAGPALSEGPKSDVGPRPEPARRLPGDYDGFEPSLAVDAKGRLIVVAMDTFAPQASRLIAWRSEDAGRTWTVPRALLESKELGARQGDPWLQSDSQGHCYVAFMGASAEHPRASSAVFGRSKDGGRTWSEPRVLGRPVDKTVLAVSPSGKYLAMTFNLFGTGDGREQRVHRSSDRGDSWQEIPVTPSRRGNYEPQGIAVNDEGAIIVGWLWTSHGRAGGQIRHVVRATSDSGRTWDETELHALDKGLGEVPVGLSEANRTGPALAVDGAGPLTLPSSASAKATPGLTSRCGPARTSAGVPTRLY